MVSTRQMSPSAEFSDGGIMDTRGQSIARIIGLVCLIGFAVDILAAALPPRVDNLQWRIAVIEQIANRGIVVLMGAGLLLISLETRRSIKRLAQTTMVAGVLALVLSGLVIFNSMALQGQSQASINSRAAQLQAQLEQAQTDPKLAEQLKASKLPELQRQIQDQASALKQQAETGVLKSGLSALGNLLVTGAGLIYLGRFGMTLRRQVR
jgi:hypothetical protein